MRLFVNRPHDNGCVYYRHTLPLRHLARNLAPLGILVDYRRRLDLGVRYDALVFARWIDAEYIPIVLDLKRQGRVICWDLDDDLLGLDRHEPDRRDEAALRIRGLELCLDLADVITVSTPHLAGRVGRPSKTFVLPNLIDFADHPMEPYQFREPTILYAASPSHRADAELLRPLHRATRRTHRWVWYGIRPEWIGAADTWIPWSRVADYPRVLRMVRPSVCVAPLAVDEFNLSKSAIKVWESAAAGASVLATRYGPYADSAAGLVEPGEPFEPRHLRELERSPNLTACRHEARRNSWGHGGEATDRWLAFYAHLAGLSSQAASQAA